MVRNITRVLLEIYLAFQQWKDFKNPLRTDKAIAMSLVYYFFWDTVYSLATNKQLHNVMNGHLTAWNVMLKSNFISTYDPAQQH